MTDSLFYCWYAEVDDEGPHLKVEIKISENAVEFRKRVTHWITVAVALLPKVTADKLNTKVKNTTSDLGTTISVVLDDCALPSVHLTNEHELEKRGISLDELRQATENLIAQLTDSLVTKKQTTEALAAMDGAWDGLLD